MPGGDTSRSAMVNPNHATMYFTVSPKPDIDDSAAASAYARIGAHLATLPASTSSTEGYRLFWARGDEVGHKDLGADDYAIVGRHSACDVPLLSAPELSLRHLLVSTTLLPDGSRGLRVLDLHASLPFYTDDGQPRRSIVASGPVVLRLGTYLFGGVPVGPSQPSPQLPAEMPRAVVRASLPPTALEDSARPVGTPAELSTMGPALVPAGPGDFYEAPPRLGSPARPAPPPPAYASHVSHVTVVPESAFLADVARQGDGSRSNGERAPTFARLTLLREGHSASLDLPAADIEAGVLIGRSERCTDGGLRRVLDGNISRVHVLLLREGDDVIAFDLCSTQGTYENGAVVRRHRFTRAGGCLSLARTNPVMLCLHPRSAAPASPSSSGDAR
jgi:hypothetical protein